MTIQNYFDNNKFNSINDTGKTWEQIGAEFGMSGEAARKKMRRHWKLNIAKEFSTNVEDEVDEFKGTRTVYSKSTEIKTLEDLIDYHQIDMSVWEVERVLTNMWDMGYKNATKEASTKQLHQIKATFRRKDVASQEFLDKKKLLEEAYTPKVFTSPQPVRGEYQTWVVMGCVHVPYHNKYLMDGVLNYISERKVDGVILAGDFLDMKSLSGYDQDKVIDTNLGDEYLAGLQVKKDIESALSEEAQKVFIWGNHEARYLKYMSMSSNARLGAALASPDKAMDMSGWDILNNWQEDYFLLGNNLEVIHGTVLAENAAAGHLRKSSINGRSVLFFHTHRFQAATVGQYSAWNCGTLCDIDNTKAFGYVDRHTRQAWQNGFAVVTVDEDGETYVQPVKCGKKSFFLDGKKY